MEVVDEEREALAREQAETAYDANKHALFSAIQFVAHDEHLSTCEKPCKCSILPKRCVAVNMSAPALLTYSDVQRARNRQRRLMQRHEAMIYRVADGVADPTRFPAAVREVVINNVLMGGLFATRTVEIGEEVAEYGGKLIFEDELRDEPGIDDAERRRRYARRSCAWAVELSTPTVLLDHYDDVGVLPAHRMDKKLGRFANSPNGRYAHDTASSYDSTALRANVRVRITFHKTPEHGARAFARGTVGAVYVRVVYVSMREIAANEEILVDYGSGYSRKHFE